MAEPQSTRRSALIAARKAAGLTQEELAHRMGVERSTIYRWEAGATKPAVWLRHGLARRLNLTLDELGHALGEADDLFAALDEARQVVDQTISTTTVSTMLIDVLERRVADHVLAYPTSAPLAVLTTIVPDILDVQDLARQRQPAIIQSRLSRSTAVLALLCADTLMKLGDIRRARYWYGTARLAADDTLEPELRARARAQETMLPYYYGDPRQAVVLAREAQALAPTTPCSSVALAAAAEARALARLGDYLGAEDAMGRAQRTMERLDSPGNAAFEFNEDRLLLYLSGTLTNMKQYERAEHIQNQALLRHRDSGSTVVIDPALIALDRAVAHATAGHDRDGCLLATSTLTALPAEHRTRIVQARANDVLAALPPARRQLPVATTLAELVAQETDIT